MQEILNDKYYRIVLDGDIEELDNEDALKIYIKCTDTKGIETETLEFKYSFLDDEYDLILHLIKIKNENRRKNV